MSLLSEAEDAYRRTRAEAKLYGAFQLRQRYRRIHDRTHSGDSVMLARLAALRDELVYRGIEPPHVRSA